MGVTIYVNILGEHLRTNYKTCHLNNSPPCNPKEFLDLGTQGNMKEGVLEIQLRTHGALLEPLPDIFKFFHAEIYVTNVFIELFRFRIGLYFSGLHLDLGTTMYELTYCHCTLPTLQIISFSRSPWISVSNTKDALADMVGL